MRRPRLPRLTVGRRRHALLHVGLIEEADSPLGNHTLGSASSIGSRTCTDSDTLTFNGVVPSDARTHTPPVTAFNSATGAAPDWVRVFAEGGAFCSNDIAITFLTSGGGPGACYRLTVMTNQTQTSCVTTGSGVCNVSSGTYSDDTNIYFVVEKICSLPIVERVTYQVNGHL